MRKYVEIFVILAIALLLGWGGYYLFSGKNEAPKPPAPVKPGITPTTPASVSPAPESPDQASLISSPGKESEKHRLGGR